MKKELNAASQYIQTAEGAVTVAAGAITVVGAAGLTYFGGKAAVTTAALAGGALIAAAVTFQTAKLSLQGAGRLMGWAQSKAKEMRSERPTLETRTAAAG